MTRPEIQNLTKDKLNEVGDTLQTRLNADISSGKIDPTHALEMVDKLGITDATKLNLKNTIVASAQAMQKPAVIHTPQVSLSDEIKKSVSSISEIAKTAVAARAEELKSQLDPVFADAQRNAKAFAEMQKQKQENEAKFLAEQKTNSEQALVDEANKDLKANPFNVVPDLKDILTTSGKVKADVNIDNLTVDNSKAEEEFLATDKSARELELVSEARKDLNNNPVTENIEVPDLKNILTGVKPNIDISGMQIKSDKPEEIPEPERMFYDPLQKQAAEARLSLLAGSRSTGEVISDNTVDLVKGATLGLGEALYGIGDFAVKTVSDAARLAAGAELTTDVPESDLIPVGLKGREDLAFSLSSGLDKLGKETIGVSLAPNFGKTREAIDEEFKSSQTSQSKALSQLAASERQANVAAVLRQRLSEKGSLSAMDKIAAQSGSMIRAIEDTWDNPVELQSVIGESLPSTFAPAAFVGAKIAKLTEGLDAAAKANFLASSAGKAKINSIATTAGIAGGATIEAATNANQVSEQIRGMSEQELMKSPVYTELLDKGYSTTEARNALENAAFTNSFLVSFAASTGSMWIGGTGLLEGLGFGLISKEANKKLGAAAVDVGVSGLKETLQEGFESAAGQVGQNIAIAATANPNKDVYQGVGDATGIGALAGGLTAGTTSTVANVGAVGRTATDVSKLFLDKFNADDKEQVAKNEAVIATINKDNLDEFVASDKHTAEEKLDALLSKEGFKVLSVVETGETANNILEAERAKVLALKAEYTAATEDKKKELIPELKKVTERFNALYNNYADQIIPLLQENISTPEQVKAILQKQLQSEDVSTESKNSYAKLYRVLGSSAESFEPEAMKTLEEENPELANFVQDIRDLNSEFENKTTNEVNEDLIKGNENIRSIGQVFTSVQQAAKTNNETWLNNSIKRLEYLTGRARLKLKEAQGYKDTDAVKELRSNLAQELTLLERSLKLAYKIRGDGVTAPEVNDSVVSDNAETAPVKAEEVKSEPVAKEDEVSKYLASKGYSENEIEEVLNNPQAALKSIVKKDAVKEDSNTTENKKEVEPVNESKVETPKEEYVEPTDDGKVRHQDVVEQTKKLQEEIRQTGTENSHAASNSKVIKELFKHLKKAFKEKTFGELKAAVQDYAAGIRSYVNNEEETESQSKYHKAGRMFAKNHNLVKHSFNALMTYRKKEKKAPLFKAKKNNVTALFKNPDLFDQIEKEMAGKPEDYEILKDLTDLELATLDTSMYMMKKIIKSIDEKIKLQFMKDGEATQSNKEILANPLLELTYKDADGNYQLDKATKIAIAVGVLNLISKQNARGEASITTLISSKANVNTFLGKKAHETLSDEDYEYFKDKGQYIGMYAEEIGKSALDLLGFSVATNLDYPDFKARLEYSMGLAGIIALVDMDYVEIRGVDTTRMIQASTNNKNVVSNSKATGRGFESETKTVRANPDKLEEFKEISDSLVLGATVLTKLFGLPESETNFWPSDKPSKASNKVKRKDATVPDSQVEQLQKHNDQPHTLSNFAGIWSKLPLAVQEAISGVVLSDELSRKHITEVSSIEAANEAMKTEISLFNNFLASHVPSVFYFTHYIVSNKRIHIENKIDVQNSKVHRWLVRNTAWLHNVETYEQRKLFQYAVVAAFNGKIDVWSDEKIESQFEKILANKDVQDAIALLKDIKNGEQGFDDHSALLRAVDFGKNHVHTAAAINALVDYHPTKPFSHDLAVEIDGKTNGFAISLLQYAGGMTDEELMHYLERTGISAEHENMSDYKGIDSYQLIAKNWGPALIRYIEQAKSLLDKTQRPKDLESIFTNDTAKMLNNIGHYEGAFNALVPSLVMNDAVTAFGRNIAKSPLMVWNYNSGFASITQKFVGEILAKVYTELADLHHEYRETDDLNRKKEIVARIAEINASFKTVLGFDPKITLNNATKFYLNNDQLNKVVSTMGYIYGISLKSAMETAFPDLTNKRNKIKWAIQRLYKRHNEYYQACLNHYIANYMQGKVLHISKEVHEEVIKRYGIPQFKIPNFGSNTELDKSGFYSTEDWIDIEDFIADVNKQFAVNELGTQYLVDQKTSSGTDLSLRIGVPTGITYTDSKGKTKELKSLGLNFEVIPKTKFDESKAIGVAPVQVHNLDAATMMGIFGSPVYNIHDAIVVGGNDVLDIAQKLNKSFYNVNMNYSIEESLWFAWDALDRVYAHEIGQLEYTESPELSRQLKAISTEYTVKIKDEVRVSSYYSDKIVFNKQAKENKQRKQKLMEHSIPYWNQYSVNKGGFRNYSAKNIKEEEYQVEAALAELLTIEEDSLDYGSAANFGTFVELSSTPIDTLDTAQNTLESLHQQDFAPTDPEHFTYLQGVLGQLGRILRPVVLKLGDAQDGTVGEYQSKNQVIRIKLRTGAPSLLRGMSNAETYVHEMVHHLIEPLIDKKNAYTDRLRWMYEVAAKHIKPEHLVELDANGNVIANPTKAQLDAAEETWKYIFENDKIVEQTVINPITGMAEKQLRHNGFQEFVAFAATNKQLRDALRDNEPLNEEFRKGHPFKMKPSSAKSSQIAKIGDYIAHFTELFFMYLSKASDKFYRVSDMKADSVLMATLNQIVDAQLKYSTSAAKGATVETKVNKAVRNFILNSLNSPAMDKMINKTSKHTNNLLGLAAYTSLNSARAAARLIKHDAVGFTLDRLYRTFDLSEDSLVDALVTELQGANKKTEYAHRLKRITNSFIDNMRITVRGNVKHFINETLFNNSLTALNKTSMYYSLIKADWKSLNYSVQDIAKFLRDDKAREARITEIKETLERDYPNNFNFYIKHALNLGLYIQTRRMNERAGAKNARMIAELNNSRGVNGYRLLTPQGDIDAAEKLIDELATLSSLEHVSLEYRNDTADLIDANPEAVKAVIHLHQTTHNLALRDNFNGNPLLMEKGYTVDVTDPKRSLVFAFGAELPELLKQGYEQLSSKPIPKDKIDPNPVKMYSLVNPINSVNTFSGGAMANTGQNARGTSLIQVRNHNNKDQLVPDYQAYLDGVKDIEIYHKKLEKEILAQNTPAKTSDDDNHTAIPVYNELGHFVTARYEMNLENKKTALKLHDAFDEALAYTASNVKDKINSKAINRVVVKTLFEDFSKYKNKPEDLKEYVFIGKTSGKQKYRDLWNLLPYDTQEEVRAVFGSEGFYIRRRNIADIMGQREMRMAEVLEGIDKIFNAGFIKALARLAKDNRFRKYEDITLELMRMVRDTIVVKSGVVPIANIVSNWLLAVLKTGNVVKTTKRIIDGFAYTNRYMALKKDVEQIKLLLATKSLTKDEQTKLKSEMYQKMDELQNNPIDFLVKNGVYQTVVEDLDPENEAFTYASDFENHISKYTNRVPEVIKDVAKFAMMTHDTRMYKFLFKATQLGDFTARYALYENNKENGMGDKENIQDIMDTFIDYDPATHPLIGYMNKMNLLLFTKYLFRAQRVLFDMATKKPVSVLALMLGQDLTMNLSDPFDAILSIDAILNRLSNPAESLGDLFGESLTSALILR